jgi:hypothetical protein
MADESRRTSPEDLPFLADRSSLDNGLLQTQNRSIVFQYLIHKLNSATFGKFNYIQPCLSCGFMYESAVCYSFLHFGLSHYV